MQMTIRVQLSIMMFLEFAIWGSWYVAMGPYLNGLGFSGIEIGSAYSTTAWAAIVSPFFVGMIADRFFSAQKVMGVLHLVGAALIFAASQVTDPGLFFWILLAHTLTYMPTIALVNAVSFHQMESPQREFPSVRVLGTIAWILINIIVGSITLSSAEIPMGIKLSSTAIPMQIAAGISVLMGIYSFTLPNTPPKSAGKRVTVRDVLGLDALGLMKDRSFAVFVGASLLVSIPLAFYYSFANTFLDAMNFEYATAKMTLGQVSEIFFLLVMPFFFARLGVKKLLLVGMLAWSLRYVLFAFGNNDGLVFMFYLGILLHGVCFDFFFVTGQIYVDNKAPKKVQASAQGFIALITYGVGMLIGTKMSGYVVEHYQMLNEAGETVLNAAGETVYRWQAIWIVPAVMAGVVALLFAILFKDDAKEMGSEDAAEETG